MTSGTGAENGGCVGENMKKKKKLINLKNKNTKKNESDQKMNSWRKRNE